MFTLDVINAIFKRRSVRKYSDKKVDKETITILLKAAMAAPTAVNCQPWEYIVVDEVEKLSKIKEKFIYARYNAPVAIIVCGNMNLALKGEDQDLWVQDCSASIENILIAATGLGLGSVWIGTYPMENRVSFLKEIFNIPKHVIPLSIVYIGYPAEEKESRTQYDEKKVYWQEYKE